MGIRKKDGKRDRKEGCQKGLEITKGIIRVRSGIGIEQQKISSSDFERERATKRERGREM